MFSNKWRTICIALYATYVLLGLFTGGIPSDFSELMAVFLVPALAIAFMYFFYKGLATRARRLGGGIKRRTGRTGK